LKDATGGGVSGDIEFCHSDPLVCVDVEVFAGLVEVLGVVAPDDVDPVFLALVDGREVAARVV